MKIKIWWFYDVNDTCIVGQSVELENWMSKRYYD